MLIYFVLGSFWPKTCMDACKALSPTVTWTAAFLLFYHHMLMGNKH